VFEVLGPQCEDLPPGFRRVDDEDVWQLSLSPFLQIHTLPDLMEFYYILAPDI
jgi:hypothetical protein